MTTNDGGGAFPGMTRHDETGYGGGVSYTPEGGMSLRDYFAAKAMQAIVAACDKQCGDGTRNLNYHTAARDAYGYADAMLAARQPKEPTP